MEFEHNPDRLRSRSALFVERALNGCRWFLQVKGLGVLTIHTVTNYDDPKGKIVPTAASALEKAEIGPAPGL